MATNDLVRLLPLDVDNITKIYCVCAGQTLDIVCTAYQIMLVRISIWIMRYFDSHSVEKCCDVFVVISLLIHRVLSSLVSLIRRIVDLHPASCLSAGLVPSA